MGETFDEIIKQTANTKRFWKTHALLEHFPSICLPKKMIIVCRNPKDVAVSFYHHTKNNGYLQYEGNFDTFFTMFVAGICGNDCYFKFYKAYWNLYCNQASNETEILWINYEDLVQSEASKEIQIRKLVEFIGLDEPLCDEDIARILDKTSLNAMKQQYNTDKEKIKHFVRKGEIGDWKNYFSKEQDEIMDTIMRMHFHGTDFKFYQDLEAGAEYLCNRTTM